jgi:hypothetical protein
MAGIIGAVVNNQSDCPDDEGIAGIATRPNGPGSEPILVALRVTQEALDDIAAGVSYAATDPKVDGQIPILNISLGNTQGDVDGLRQAMRNAYLCGLLMCCAGGNDEWPAWAFKPAGFARFAVGVGAIEASGAHPSDFNIDPSIDIVAPGGSSEDQKYWTTSLGQGAFPFLYHEIFGATSGATAQISGIASLVLTHTAANGVEATNEDLYELITRRARDLGTEGWDETFGFGLARLDAVLCWLEERTLVHESALGWDDSSSVVDQRDFYNMADSPLLPDTIWGEAMLADTKYALWTRVYKLEKDVPFTSNPSEGPMDSTNVWARGRQCTGWRDAESVNYAEDATWAAVDPNSVTSDGCRLFTHYYKVYADRLPPNVNALDSLWAWFPWRPFGLGAQPVSWAYTYLYEPASGRDAPAVLGPDRGAARARVEGRASIILDRETLIVGEVFDVTGRLLGGGEARGRGAGDRVGRHGLTREPGPLRGSLPEASLVVGGLGRASRPRAAVGEDRS